MMRLGHSLALVLCLGGVALAAPDNSPSEASLDPTVWVISPAEAALPLGRALLSEKSDPDGPKVIVRDPGEVAEVTPPVTIDVMFEAGRDAVVDLASLKVTYLKLFGIDITRRLRPYLTPTGIHAVNAPLAPGRHTIEISVNDTAGRRTVERFSFTVLRQ